jgi:hypothetical protein
MKLLNFLLLSGSLLLGNYLLAAEGDTTRYRIHDKTHLKWYGNYDSKGKLPDGSKKYRKILMHYTMGCPTTGCSGWDYTTKIELLRKTGQMDSTLIKYPSFKVLSPDRDTLYYRTDTTYTYSYNSTTKKTDSTANAVLRVVRFSDTNNPGKAIDTLVVWQANYYNRNYDSTGKVIDSFLVTHSQVMYKTITNVYNKFEVLDPIELARVITPYANAAVNPMFNATTWKFTWDFDVTDYAPLLKDSVTIRAHFSGYQDGFTVTLDFEFIEGTPPAEVIGVKNLWHGSYQYGVTANPISAKVTPQTVNIPADADVTRVRIVPTGHSFGDAENCAEFCPKNYYVGVNGTQQYTHLMWRDDCGMNPLYPQTGTWIYDRANWCPGGKGLAHDHDLSSFVTKGQNNTVSLDFEPYTTTGTGGNIPSYILDGQLFTYKTPAFTNDAAMEDIITPSLKDEFKRYNPACNNPVVVIRNTGKNPLTSLIIEYGAEGGVMWGYNWSGNLKFLEYDTVALPAADWGNFAQPAMFRVSVRNPNGVADEYASNNVYKTPFVRTPKYTGKFYLQLRTNNAGAETYFKLTNAAGTVLYSRDNMANATTYRDTFDLPRGCYELTIYDRDKDGIYFWANNDGSGTASLRSVNNQLLYNFERDFGTQITHRFTMDWTLGDEGLPVLNEQIQLYPNPSQGAFSIDFALPVQQEVKVTVLNIIGAVVAEQFLPNAGFDTEEIHVLEGKPAGTYFVQIQTLHGTVTRKLIIQ